MATVKIGSRQITGLFDTFQMLCQALVKDDSRCVSKPEAALSCARWYSFAYVYGLGKFSIRVRQLNRGIETEITGVIYSVNTGALE